MRVIEKMILATTAKQGSTLSVAFALAVGTLLFAVAGCSVVPDWSEREAEDLLITVDYGPGRRLVEIPKSGRDLVVRNLFSHPSPPVEAFEDGVRKLQVPVEGLRLECRLRLYRGEGHSDVDPATLFPGARSVSTWSRRAGAPPRTRGSDDR